MSGVFYLCDVLQFVIDRFNQGSFSEQNLVGNTHQRILHIVFNFSDKLYTIKGKVLKQSLTDIAFVCTEFSFDVFQKLTSLQQFPVVYVSRREHKIENLTFVIDYQMQLESEEPSHGAFAPLGKSIESLVNEYALVTAYTQRGGIHEADASACTKQRLLDENGQRKQDLLLQLHETVVGNKFREQMGQMFSDILLVIMLEASETTGVK